MGLRNMMGLASGDSVVDGFTRDQVQQLLLAEQNGVPDTECRKHKEWGPTLMNVCWNKEKEGKDIAPIYRVAEWLSVLPKDENGLLYDNCDIVLCAYKLSSNYVSLPDVGKYINDDGIVDECMLKFVMEKEKMISEGADVLWSGRVSFNNVDMFNDSIIMGEGIKKAQDIASSLQSWSANKRTQNNPDDPLGTMGMRAWNMMNILLGLDDMNIRGYQLIYAMEYVDGSIEKLYEVLDGGRSQELVAYVNKKSAEAYMGGYRSQNQVAVCSGASFCHDGSMGRSDMNRSSLIMTMDKAEDFATANVQPISVDYSKLDIVNRVDFESAIRICEARGFEIVRFVPRQRERGERVGSLIMYNQKTRDYIVANSCMDDNISYGGTSLYVHRTIPQERWRETFDWLGSSGGHDGQEGMYYEWTYNDGLFKYWEHSLDFVPEKDYDWSLIGFGHYGIPIPKYFDMPVIYSGTLQDSLDPKAYYLMHDMGSYYFEKLVNKILCLYDEELKNSCSPHYSLYEDWFYSHAVTSDNSWWEPEDEESSGALALALTYLKVPDDIVKRLEQGAAEWFKSRDERDREQQQRGGWLSNIGKKSRYDRFMSIAKNGINKSSIAEQVISVYGLPDPQTLPIVLPWL